MKKKVIIFLILSFICFCGYKGYMWYLEQKEMAEMAQSYLDALFGDLTYEDILKRSVGEEEWDKESYILGYTKGELATMGLDWKCKNEGLLPDNDEDGLSDYDELITYHSNPKQYSTANDLYSDKYKIQNNMDVNTYYEGYNHDNNKSNIVTYTPKTTDDLLVSIEQEDTKIYGINCTALYISGNGSKMTIDLSNYNNYEVIKFSTMPLYCKNITYKVKNKQLNIFPISWTDIYIVPKESANIFQTLMNEDAGITNHKGRFIRYVNRLSSENEFVNMIIQFLQKILGAYLEEEIIDDFSLELNTFSFKNFTYKGVDGVCAGISSVAAKIFNEEIIPLEEENIIDGNMCSYNLTNNEFLNYIENKNIREYKNENYKKFIERGELTTEELQVIELIFLNFVRYNDNLQVAINEPYINYEDSYYNYNKYENMKEVLEDNKNKILCLSLYDSSSGHCINVIGHTEKETEKYKFLNLSCYDSNHPDSIQYCNIIYNKEKDITSYYYVNSLLPYYTWIGNSNIIKNKTTEQQKTSGIILTDSDGNPLA